VNALAVGFVLLHVHSLVVRIQWLPLVIQEKRRVLLSTDGLKRTRCLGQVIKLSEVSLRSQVGEHEPLVGKVEVVLEESQNGAKIVAIVVDISLRSVGRDKDKRNAETILVLVQPRLQNSRRFVVVPAAPIVPRDDNGGVVPVTGAGITANRIPDRI
jgi:hypothetical protein